MARKGTPPLLLGALVILLMLLASAGTAYYLVYMRAVPDEDIPDEAEPVTPQVLDLTRPWKIDINDTKGENTTAAGYVAIYSTDDSLVENVVFTGGMATTTDYYTSGQRYNFRVGADGFVDVWKSATVPKGASAEDAYLHSTVSIIDLGTFEATALAPDATYLSETAPSCADNLDKTDATKPTVTFIIRNSEDDSGWMTSRDPLLDRDYKCVFWMLLENGEFEDIVVSGVTARYETRSDRRTWYVDIPTNKLIYDKDASGTIISDGRHEVAITLDLTGWTDSTAIGCAYGLATYTSEEYYAYYGSWGTLSDSSHSSFVIQQ